MTKQHENTQLNRAAWTVAIWTMACSIIGAVWIWWNWGWNWSLPFAATVNLLIGAAIMTIVWAAYKYVLPSKAKNPLLELLTQLLTWFDRQRNPVLITFWPNSPLLSIGVYLLCLGVSLAAALSIYQFAVVTAQDNIDHSYQRVNVFEDALRNETDVNWVQLRGVTQEDMSNEWPLDSMDVRDRERLLFSLLKNFSIIEQDIHLNENGDTRGERLKDLSDGRDAIHFLFDFILQVEGTKANLSPEENFLGVPRKVKQDDGVTHYPNSTANLIVHLSTSIGRNDNIVGHSNGSKQDPKALRARLLCAALSGKVGAARQLGDLARAKSQTESNSLNKVQAEYDHWNSLPQRELSVWFSAEGARSDAELLNSIFHFDQVMIKPFPPKDTQDPNFPGNSFGPFFEPDNTSNYNTLNRNDFLLIESFILELLSRLHSNPDVKSAKRWFAIVYGPEQFAMLWMSLWMISILIIRLAIRWYEWSQLEKVLRMIQAGDSFESGEGLAYRMWQVGDKAEDKDTDNRIEFIADQASMGIPRSRWLISWIATALPAIGFIGTVRGMLLALGEADSIVRASTVAGRAAAITEVGSQLSLAFTTTLIALLLGLLTSFFSSLQKKSEQSLVARCEARIASSVHPELHTALTYPDWRDDRGEVDATPST